MSKRRSVGWAIAVVLGSVVAAGGCNALIGLEEGKPRPGAGVCEANGKEDGSETDVDCGGGCALCSDGKGCSNAADCVSHVCIAGSCAAPRCDDHVKNGDELDQDCGGSCGKCGPDQVCNADQDCKSGTCMNGTCLSTCTDTVKGGSETDVDCGGSCPACPNEKGCKLSADCQSGVCKADACVDFHVWSKHFGGPTDMDVIRHAGIAIDGAGTATLVTTVDGAVDFGGGPLTGSPDQSDITVAKFNMLGGHVLSNRYADAQDQSAAFLAVSSSGELFLPGRFSGTLVLDGTHVLKSVGILDVFLAKLSVSAAPVFTKGFGDAKSESTPSVAVDGSGNVVMTGSINGSIDFGKGTLTSAGSSDVFVAKLGSTGIPAWSKLFGDSDDQFGTHIAVDSAGNIIVTGFFSGTINLGGGVLTSSAGPTTYDLYIAKLDPTGAHVWSKRFGSMPFDILIDLFPGADFNAGAVAVDGAGNVILASGVNGSVDFGGGPLASIGNQDLFVVKLDPLGNHLWSKRFGGQGNVVCQLGCSIAVDKAGNVLVIGDFTGVIDFGGGPLLSAGGSDVFVAKLDPSGKHLWSRRFGDVEDQFGAQIAAYDTEFILITGYFRGNIDLGGGPFANMGGQDAFLAKLRTP